MTKNVFRKSLVLAVIVLFIGASIIPSIGSISIKKQYLKKEKGKVLKKIRRKYR